MKTPTSRVRATLGCFSFWRQASSRGGSGRGCAGNSSTRFGETTLICRRRRFCCRRPDRRSPCRTAADRRFSTWYGPSLRPTTTPARSWVKLELREESSRDEVVGERRGIFAGGSLGTLRPAAWSSSYAKQQLGFACGMRRTHRHSRTSPDLLELRHNFRFIPIFVCHGHQLCVAMNGTSRSIDDRVDEIPLMATAKPWPGATPSRPRLRASLGLNGRGGHRADENVVIFGEHGSARRGVPAVAQQPGPAPPARASRSRRGESSSPCRARNERHDPRRRAWSGAIRRRRTLHHEPSRRQGRRRGVLGRAATRSARRWRFVERQGKQFQHLVSLRPGT